MHVDNRGRFPCYGGTLTLIHFTGSLLFVPGSEDAMDNPSPGALGSDAEEAGGSAR